MPRDADMYNIKKKGRKKKMKKWMALLLSLLLSLSLAACNSTDSGNEGGGGDAETAELDYPTKAITVIVPFSAGGEHDLTARVLAKRMKEMFDWDIVISNTTGDAAATIEYMNDSGNADGYSLAITSGDCMISV